MTFAFLRRVGAAHIACALCAGALCAGTAQAAPVTDGVTQIDQNKALAGSVTPGDAPGFPITITRPGSYRLTSNLTVPDADTTAIEIAADHVTLDLNGFAILGPTDCSQSPCTRRFTGSARRKVASAAPKRLAWRIRPDEKTRKNPSEKNSSPTSNSRIGPVPGS